MIDEDLAIPDDKNIINMNKYYNYMTAFMTCKN